MDRGEAADDGVVTDFDMACESPIIGKDHVVTDDAVVGDVGVGEKVSVVADFGQGVWSGAAVDGDEFAEAVAVADFEVGGFGDVFEVLGFLTDGAEGVELVACADGGWAVEADVVLEPATGPEGNVGANDGVGADFAVIADLGGRVDDGGGMDLCAHGSTTPNIISASLTTSPLTRQRPRALTMAFFRWVISTSMKRVSPGTTGLRNLTASALIK